MMSDAEAQKAITNLVIRSAVDIANGKSKQDIISRLTGEGCSPEFAAAIATRAEELKQAEFRRGGIKTILMGAAFCGIGLLITMTTYAMASGGGYYVVTGGLIVGGIFIMIKGFWRFAFR